jgi:hypothetical protein
MVHSAYSTEVVLSDYRRCYVPGGSYFFMGAAERRAGILANDLARHCFAGWISVFPAFLT